MQTRDISIRELCEHLIQQLVSEAGSSEGADSKEQARSIEMVLKASEIPHAHSLASTHSSAIGNTRLIGETRFSRKRQTDTTGKISNAEKTKPQ